MSICDNRNNKYRCLYFCMLAVYLMIIVYITILCRDVSIHGYEKELFWSYKAWLVDGNYKLGIQCLENIAFFVPLGLMVASLAGEKVLRRAAIVGAAVSALVELGQLYFGRGLCELDDVLNNTVGAVCGAIGYCIIKAFIKRRVGESDQLLHRAVIGIELLCIAVGCGVCYWETTRDGQSQSQMTFQLDSVTVTDEGYIFDGYCFGHDLDTTEVQSDITILLKSLTGGGEIAAETSYGLERPDVNSYFYYDTDFTNSGFRAFVPADEYNINDEYEVYVKWGRFKLPADTYVSGCSVERIAKADYEPIEDCGEDLERIITDGTALVCRPDYHCLVYQYCGQLYWIVDDEFYFEEDGSTYIQYQLWTTQPYNLPETRLENGWFWDNIGFNFEKYEITGEIDCGGYRVAAREIPTKYAVTEILTGYYADGEWVWKEYFRPVIKEGKVS